MVEEYGTMQDEGMVEEQNPIQVNDEVVIESLDDVKEEKQLVPPARNVKMQIKKASIGASKDNAYRWVDLQLQIVDGIDMEGSYKNKTVFGRVCFYADMQKYGEKDYFVKKQHLVQLKNLLKALSIDLSNVKINDAFLEGITGQTVLADIRQTKGDDNYGPQNEVLGYKEVPTESMV